MENLLPCEEDEFITKLTEYITLQTEWLARIERKVDMLVDTLERFRPMLDRYEQASKVNKLRTQRAVLKGKK